MAHTHLSERLPLVEKIEQLGDDLRCFGGVGVGPAAWTTRANHTAPNEATPHLLANARLWLWGIEAPVHGTNFGFGRSTRPLSSEAHAWSARAQATDTNTSHRASCKTAPLSMPKNGENSSARSVRGGESHDGARGYSHDTQEASSKYLQSSSSSSSFFSGPRSGAVESCAVLASVLICQRREPLNVAALAHTC